MLSSSLSQQVHLTYKGAPMSTTQRISASFVASLLLLVVTGGCNTLKDYVEGKNFTYIEGYSTRNPIGMKIVGKEFEPHFAVPMNVAEDALPGEKRTGKTDFEVTGEADFSKLLNATGDLKISGSTGTVKETTFDVASAAVVSFASWNLKELPPERSMEFEYIFQTLRIGDLDLTVETKSDSSAKAEIDVTEVGSGKVSWKWNTEDKATITGSNLVVGYKSRKVRFDTVASRVPFAIKNELVCASPEVGLCGFILDMRFDGSSWEALVKISTTAVPFLVEVPPAEALTMPVIAEFGLMGEAAGVLDDPIEQMWDSAIVAEEEDGVIAVRDGQIVRIRQLNKMSLDAQNGQDVVFAQVKAITPDSVNMEVSRVSVTIIE